MPVNESGQGNSPNTPVKQHSFRYFLAVHGGVVAYIQKKYTWPDQRYYYIDTNAGTGRNEDGSEGSVLLARRILHEQGHTPYGIVIEKVPQAATLLRQVLHGLTDFVIYERDNKELLDICRFPAKQPWGKPPPKYGLLYSDPNGVHDFPLSAVAKFFTQPETRYMDFLLSIGANHLKRCYAAGLQTFRLPDIISDIPKASWYIREGYWRDQWTLLFGTNWDHWPELKIRVDGMALKNLRSLGLFRIGSPEGQQVLNELSYTHAEMQKKSPQFPTEPIVNTLPIPDFLR